MGGSLEEHLPPWHRDDDGGADTMVAALSALARKWDRIREGG